MFVRKSALLTLTIVALVVGLVGLGPARAQDKVTLSVWDYYGDSTPIKPLVDKFQQENPAIAIQLEGLDWNTTQEKLNVVLTSEDTPDVVTIDMTWLPKFAPLGAFTDLTALSGGKLNGVALDKSYTPGALQSITYNQQTIAMLYDFDVYALYYRADLFDKKGLQPPKTWDDLVNVASKLVENKKYQYEYIADPFHAVQFIYENGGGLLNEDNTKAIFAEPKAVSAVEFYASLLKKALAINWTVDSGEVIQGIKDGRIAMFSDGPYFMGILKTAAPEMAGQWKVAAHPIPKDGKPGSYLGGTGLVIPTKSKHKEAAWKFIEYLMRPENQLNVYKVAGAAPALSAVLESPDLNAADPYFGGQKPFAVFYEAMKTAHPFPYVRQWDDIGQAITTAMQEIALGQKTVQQALEDAATTTNDALAK
ncbi:MAG TPA: sugar ABC transporter substrate-binding protein [Aggregatilineales bacterium]|nr:sugar ABC transporter substrate-binding protein [Aggregatilineales bacterium]